MLIVALSQGELVVDRRKEGLTSVPRDIDEGATTLKLDGNSITRLLNDSFDYLLSLEALLVGQNGISFIERYALEKNTCLYKLGINGHKLAVFPTHLGGAAPRIRVLDSRGASYVKTMQLIDLPRLRDVALNFNNIVNGILTMKSLPALKELYAPACKLQVFPNLSAAPALEFVQLHFNNLTTLTLMECTLQLGVYTPKPLCYHSHRSVHSNHTPNIIGVH